MNSKRKEIIRKRLERSSICTNYNTKSYDLSSVLETRNYSFAENKSENIIEKNKE